MMLSCSVIIAGLGLLQNSPAVIIGAMLVAPLMTPLIGTGLSLVQGNFGLLFTAVRSMGYGTVISLILGVILQILTPGSEPTMEIANRGEPNLLDLAIAFFAGVAAGYALAKPKLSGALPGVAISVALVPPLAASGLALGAGDWFISLGSLLLCLVNMVAIVLGSASIFWLHHINLNDTNRTKRQSLIMRRIVIGLGMALILFTAPLTFYMVGQLKQGVAKPDALAIPEELWYKLYSEMDNHTGIDFLTATRASSHRPQDVNVVITTDRPVPGALIAQLDTLINTEMGRGFKVKFVVILV